jgi:hypothetical protein
MIHQTQKLYTYKLHVFGPPVSGELEQMVVAGSPFEAGAEVEGVADAIRHTGAEVHIKLVSTEEI